MQPLIERAIAAVPRQLRSPVRIAVRTVDNAIADRLPGLAGEIAFWVLLSLPALILTIVAAFGAIGDQLGADWEAQLTERVSEAAGLVLTASAIEGTVLPLLEQLITGGGIGVVSIAFVTAIWTASRAVKVLVQTIGVVAHTEQTRKGWQDRLLGFAITLASMLIGLVLAPLLLAGPNLGEQLATWIGVGGSGIALLWRTLYWPVMVAAATLAIWVLYHVAIPGKHAWLAELPGAVLATGVWLAGSAGLRVYASTFMTADSIYGSLAGPIVALLWLWLSGFAVLLGAELNATMRTDGRTPVE